MAGTAGTNGKRTRKKKTQSVDHDSTQQKALRSALSAARKHYESLAKNSPSAKGPIAKRRAKSLVRAPTNRNFRTGTQDIVHKDDVLRGQLRDAEDWLSQYSVLDKSQVDAALVDLYYRPFTDRTNGTYRGTSAPTSPQRSPSTSGKNSVRHVELEAPTFRPSSARVENKTAREIYDTPLVQNSPRPRAPSPAPSPDLELGRENAVPDASVLRVSPAFAMAIRKRRQTLAAGAADEDPGADPSGAKSALQFRPRARTETPEGAREHGSYMHAMGARYDQKTRLRRQIRDVAEERRRSSSFTTNRTDALARAGRERVARIVYQQLVHTDDGTAVDVQGTLDSIDHLQPDVQRAVRSVLSQFDGAAVPEDDFVDACVEELRQTKQLAVLHAGKHRLRPKTPEPSKEDLELEEECTFTPQIDKRSRAIAESARRHSSGPMTPVSRQGSSSSVGLSLFDRLYSDAHRRNVAIEKAQEAKQREALEECTFMPQISESPMTTENRRASAGGRLGRPAPKRTSPAGKKKGGGKKKRKGAPNGKTIRGGSGGGGTSAGTSRVSEQPSTTRMGVHILSPTHQSLSEERMRDFAVYSVPITPKAERTANDNAAAAYIGASGPDASKGVSKDIPSPVPSPKKSPVRAPREPVSSPASSPKAVPTIRGGGGAKQAAKPSRVPPAPSDPKPVSSPPAPTAPAVVVESPKEPEGDASLVSPAVPSPTALAPAADQSAGRWRSGRRRSSVGAAHSAAAAAAAAAASSPADSSKQNVSSEASPQASPPPAPSAASPQASGTSPASLAQPRHSQPVVVSPQPSNVSVTSSVEEEKKENAPFDSVLSPVPEEAAVEETATSEEEDAAALTTPEIKPEPRASVDTPSSLLDTPPQTHVPKTPLPIADSRVKPAVIGGGGGEGLSPAIATSPKTPSDTSSLLADLRAKVEHSRQLLEQSPGKPRTTPAASTPPSAPAAPPTPVSEPTAQSEEMAEEGSEKEEAPASPTRPTEASPDVMEETGSDDVISDSHTAESPSSPVASRGASTSGSPRKAPVAPPARVSPKSPAESGTCSRSASAEIVDAVTQEVVAEEDKEEEEDDVQEASASSEEAVPRAPSPVQEEAVPSPPPAPLSPTAVATTGVATPPPAPIPPHVVGSPATPLTPVSPARVSEGEADTSGLNVTGLDDTGITTSLTASDSLSSAGEISPRSITPLPSGGEEEDDDGLSDQVVESEYTVTEEVTAVKEDDPDSSVSSLGASDDDHTQEMTSAMESPQGGEVLTPGRTHASMSESSPADHLPGGIAATPPTPVTPQRMHGGGAGQHSSTHALYNASPLQFDESPVSLASDSSLDDVAAGGNHAESTPTQQATEPVTTPVTAPVTEATDVGGGAMFVHSSGTPMSPQTQREMSISPASPQRPSRRVNQGGVAEEPVAVPADGAPVAVDAHIPPQAHVAPYVPEPEPKAPRTFSRGPGGGRRRPLKRGGGAGRSGPGTRGTGSASSSGQPQRGGSHLGRRGGGRSSRSSDASSSQGRTRHVPTFRPQPRTNDFVEPPAPDTPHSPVHVADLPVDHAEGVDADHALPQHDATLPPPSTQQPVVVVPVASTPPARVQPSVEIPSGPPPTTPAAAASPRPPLSGRRGPGSASRRTPAGQAAPPPDRVNLVAARKSAPVVEQPVRAAVTVEPVVGGGGAVSSADSSSPILPPVTPASQALGLLTGLDSQESLQEFVLDPVADPTADTVRVKGDAKARSGGRRIGSLSPTELFPTDTSAEESDRYGERAWAAELRANELRRPSDSMDNMLEDSESSL